VNKSGADCIILNEETKKAQIDEDICNGCGICVKVCPFDAITIVNLATELSTDKIHQYGINSFRLYKLPTPNESIIAASTSCAISFFMPYLRISSLGSIPLVRRPSILLFSSLFPLGVFLMTGSSSFSNKSSNSWIVGTIGWGLAVTLGVYASGQVSGAHINPAVTIGLLSSGEMELSLALKYLTGQVMGAFIGALIRPIGGKIADKVGGAIVTQIVSIVMVISAIGVGYYAKLAYQSVTPQDYFLPFFVLLVILFTATGIGNGSTFRTISMVFNEEQAGPVLGWTSAVAAYGAFLIPKVIGENMSTGTPELAMYGFAVFYAACAILNYWYYLGPKKEYNNP